jgi:hypothetical protein
MRIKSILRDTLNDIHISLVIIVACFSVINMYVRVVLASVLGYNISYICGVFYRLEVSLHPIVFGGKDIIFRKGCGITFF